jgi:hypothetical protein
MTAPDDSTARRAGTCVRPPHPENAETGHDDRVVMASDSALSRFARWVAYAPAERGPLPAIPAAWTAAEILHLFAVPVMYPGAAAVAAAGLAYGLASRRGTGDDGDDDGDREEFSPAEAAVLTGAAGGWLALGDAAGPLAGGFPPWVSLGYLAAAGCAWCWLRMHPATRGARARKEAAELAVALDIARKTQWHQFAAMIGLDGSHLLAFEETYLGDRRLVDTRGTRKRASSLATQALAEHIAELEMLPKGRVEVYPDRVAGRLWIEVRRIDPWRKPVMHPAASGQLDRAAEFAQYVPPRVSIRDLLAIGIDPETGRPLAVRLYASGGAKVVSITAKKEGGKTTLLDSLKERITACDDARLLQINLSKALEDRWWAPAAAGSALGSDAARALMILQFLYDLVVTRGQSDRSTRVHQPTPEEPAWVLVVDEVDALVSIPEARQLLQLLVSKCRSEGVIVILAGQRNTAQWTGGGDVQSQMDIAIWGKFARDSRERGHVAGADANLPSMSEYGEGHPGVFGVTDLPPTGDFAKGRTFYWGESSTGIRRLIAARAAARPPVRLERALRALQPLWDAITSTGPDDDIDGYDGIGVMPPGPAGPAPVAAAAVPDPRFDVRFGAGGQAVPGTAVTRAKIGAAWDSIAVGDETAAAFAEVDPARLAAVTAQRQAQAFAANYGDVDVPAAAMQVLTRLLADPAGTSASEAGEAIREATGTGSKSLAHRYLQALRVAGIARLDGSGRGARFRLATSPAPAGAPARPGLAVVPDSDDDDAPAAPGTPLPVSGRGAALFMLGDATRLVVEYEFASARFLARKLGCTPGQAAGLIAQLQALRIIGPDDGTGAHDVLVSPEDISAAAGAVLDTAAGGDGQ